MRKRVLLRGPFLTNSGYGVHSRQVARWAISRPDWDVKCQVLPWGITPWLLDRDDESGLIGKIMDRTAVESLDRFDLSIQVQLPDEWDAGLAKKNIGVTAGVETDICNPSWIDKCNQMSCVVVPSLHTKETLVRTGGDKLRTPVLVIPESYHDEMAEESGSLSVDFSTSFNFLVFGQITGNNPENDRKNLFYTLKWMFDEFRDNDDVGIVLKTNSGKMTKIDRALTEKVVRKIVAEARTGPYPRVHFLHGKMTNSEVSGLMKHPKIKSMVSLTRGEGYGLPLLEAAASGLPIIATGWSGYNDFLKSGDYIQVDYKLAPIHKTRIDGKIFIEGAQWAHPDEIDAKKRMRKFYQSSKMPTKRAKETAKRICKDFSFSAISRLYDEAFLTLNF